MTSGQPEGWARRLVCVGELWPCGAWPFLFTGDRAVWWSKVFSPVEFFLSLISDLVSLQKTSAAKHIWKWRNTTCVCTLKHCGKKPFLASFMQWKTVCSGQPKSTSVSGEWEELAARNYFSCGRTKPPCEAWPVTCDLCSTRVWPSMYWHLEITVEINLSRWEKHNVEWSQSGRRLLALTFFDIVSFFVKRRHATELDH